MQTTCIQTPHLQDTETTSSLAWSWPPPGGSGASFQDSKWGGVCEYCLEDKVASRSGDQVWKPKRKETDDGEGGDTSWILDKATERKEEGAGDHDLQGLHLCIPEIQDAQRWIPIGQYPTNEVRRWRGGWVPLTRLKHSPRSS